MAYYVFDNGEALETDYDATAYGTAKKVTKKAYLAARQAYALKQLHELIKPGDTVWTCQRAPTRHTVHVVANYVGTDRPAIRNVTKLVVDAAGFRMNRDGEIVQGGGGYSKAFQIVYSLGSVMWPNGTPEPHGTRNGEPDTSGGYALKQDSI